MRHCADKQCKSENPQPLGNFSYDRGRPRSRCRECINRRAREWNKNNPEKKTASYRRWVEKNPNYEADAKLKRQFGVGLQYKQALVEGQEGRCGNPGCSTNVSVKDSLDHNHTTNAIRGVLCDPCNLALGLLKENTARIYGLADYLSRFDVSDAKDKTPRLNLVADATQESSE